MRRVGEQPTEAPAPEGRRAQIVEAALDLLAERGYQGTSLGAIARRVGLSQPGLLHYFGSKDDLLMEALTEWERSNERRLRAVLGETFTFSEHLRHLVALHEENPKLVRTFMLLATGSLATHHPTQAYFRRRYRAVRRRVAERLADELGTALAPRVSPEQGSMLVIAFLDGLELQWLLDPEEVSFSEAAEALLRLLAPEA
jgi:AcrR family transcriptional regulator